MKHKDYDIHTEVSPDSFHVGSVSRSRYWIWRTIRICQHCGGVVGNARETYQGKGPHNPSQLRDAPRKRKHPGSEDSRENVSHGGPYSSYKINSALHVISCYNITMI